MSENLVEKLQRNTAKCMIDKWKCITNAINCQEPIREIIMPLVGFICPDGEKISLDDCINGQCRMNVQCMSKSSLIIAGNAHPYHGVSPSMSGTGPHETFLKETVDYFVSPNDNAWAILGTRVHGGLSQYGDGTEEPLKLRHGSFEMEGTTDLLIPTEGKWNEIWDYKVCGSFKAMKYLGIKKERETIRDEKGNPIKYKSGQKKGQIKKRNKFTQKPEYVDIKNETYQTNCYRVMAEQQGRFVSNIFIEAIIRDGGLMVANSRGIDRNIYVIPIPFMDATEVINFYMEKQKGLDLAFKNSGGPKCSKEETWEGRKCEAYCDVRDHCKYNKKEVL